VVPPAPLTTTVPTLPDLSGTRTTICGGCDAHPASNPAATAIKPARLAAIT
jgi:hypothetical protein